MIDRVGSYEDHRERVSVKPILWFVLALVACLWVLAVNGRPLFYWDTVGYIEQGQNALAKVGFKPPLPRDLPPPAAAVTAPAPGDAGTEPAVDAAAPKTVDGSRSLSYSVLSGLLANLGVLDLLVAIHAIAVLVAVWIPARVLSRRYAPGRSAASVVALTLLAASVGSMPFFVAYLMPDIFAPVMVLCIATLAVFGRDLLWWELVLTLGLGVVAVVAHLSHLGIAVLLSPLVLIVAVVALRRNWWLVMILIGVLVAAGFAQQAVIRSAARSVAKSEVVIKPFLTARLIQDGPGWSYLKAHCPAGDNQPECPLYDKLAVDDDPWHRTASHIIFQTTAELGSFRLLPAEDQIRIARAQVGFFLRVLRDQPINTAYAFLKNTAIQTGMVSVDMTIPTQNIIDQHRGVAGLIEGAFDHGRLTRTTGWIGPATFVQAAWYILAALTISILLVRSAAPREVKLFVIVLVLGILVNAFVCGAISQPATRYGSRMIWLLPLAASFLLLFRHPAMNSERVRQ